MKRLSALAALLVVTLVAAVAVADSTVVVHVRMLGGEAVDAVVTLTPVSGGGPQSCRTSRGTCRIANVRGGNYIVTAEPVSRGEPPLPRRLLLPPDGEVEVHVTLQ